MVYADLHCHSNYSDGVHSLEEVFIKYKIKIDLSISHVRENAIAMAVVSIDKEWK